MAAAVDPELRKQFRRPNFASGIRLTTKGKKGLMSEEQAREEENEGIDPRSVVERCIAERGTILDLSYFSIETLPDNIHEATAVEVVDLQRNKLTHLPETIGTLTNIRRFNASSNRIKEVPYTILQWSHVVDINLSGNLISSLPDEFSFLDSLRHLTLDYCYFTEIPECLGELAELEECFMVENSGIQRLPSVEWFRVFRKLGLALDNSPALSQQWEEMQDALPNVNIRWNKIWPDRIEEGIYLGSLRTAQNPEALISLGVTHVLTCGRGLQTTIPESITAKGRHLQLEVEDNEVEDLSPHFNEALDFIKGAVEGGGSVLIHCFAGVSRSATICVAFLMREKGMTNDEAIEYVKTHRPAINPNPSFRTQLQRYGDMLTKLRRGADEAP